jgi:hypothetical protein
MLETFEFDIQKTDILKNKYKNKCIQTLLFFL